MSNFMRHSASDKKQTIENFMHVSADYLMYQFRDGIDILSSEEAETRILEHPKCPFYNFAFTGECELNREWYYVAANGSLNNPSTRVLLLRK